MVKRCINVRCITIKNTYGLHPIVAGFGVLYSASVRWRHSPNPKVRGAATAVTGSAWCTQLPLVRRRVPPPITRTMTRFGHLRRNSEPPLPRWPTKSQCMGCHPINLFIIIGIGAFTVESHIVCVHSRCESIDIIVWFEHIKKDCSYNTIQRVVITNEVKRLSCHWWEVSVVWHT